MWHRRAGKDDFGLRVTSVAAHERVGNYWHMLPEAAQARKAIWDAINPHTGRRRIDEAFPHELRKSTNETEMMIDFLNGSTWQVVGSDNFNSLVGSPPLGVVFSEYALANPNSWNMLRPILAENGGFAMFISTPRGPNHLKRMFDASKSRPDWFVERLQAKDTKAIPDDTLLKELKELQEELGDDEGKAVFEQEYNCSFESAILGSIYGTQLSKARMEGRITNVPYDPYLPVGTMWDLGVSDSTAILFFQLKGERVNFIDYHKGNNMGLDSYVKILRKKPYTYDQNMMFFPHDIEHREISTGQTRVSTLLSLGVTPVVAAQHAVWDGISLVRRNFHRYWFDEINCEELIEAMSLYQREYDPVNKVFRNRPKHDWTSHPCDALRTGQTLLPESAPRAMVGQPSRDYFRNARKQLSRPHSFWSA